MQFGRMYMFTAIAMGILSIVPVTGQHIQEDKVCYLDDHTPACKYHLLGCVRDEIAILSAEYAYTSDCTCVRQKCTTCCSDGKNVLLQPSGICSNDYNKDDHRTFIKACSKQKDCNFTVPGQRQYKKCSSKTAFSHIRYRCVDATYEVNMCGSEEQIGQYVSLFYDGSSSSNANQRCVCTVSGNEQQPTDTYNITALDIRMGDVGNQEAPQLVLSYPDNVPTVINNTTNIRPNTLLLTTLSSTTEVKLDFKYSHTAERIWIMVEGQGDVRVKCETVSIVPVTEQGPFQTDMPEAPYAVIGGATGGGTGLLVLVGFAVFIYRRQASSHTEASTEAMMKLKTEHEYFVIELMTAEDNVLQDTGTINQPGKRVIRPIPAGSECTSNEPQYVDVDMVTDDRGGPTSKECGDVQTRKDPQENDYNYLVASRAGQRFVEAHYDTALSASKAVKELESQENYYSYDHLGVLAKPAVTANEYDTTFLSTQDLNSQCDVCSKIS